MCSSLDGSYIPARDYFAEAKRRNRDLKKLRSVSRAYRKTEVAAIKHRAIADQTERERAYKVQLDQFERQKRERYAGPIAGGYLWDDYLKPFR